MHQGEGKGQQVFDNNLVPVYSDEIKKAKSDLLFELKLLWKDKKFDEIVSTAETKLNDLPNNPSGKGDRDLSAIYLIYATSLWETTKNKDNAINTLKRSLAFDRTNQPALWLLREIREESSVNSKLMRIDVNGEYFVVFNDGSTKKVPFSTLYKVIAETPDEALGYIKDYERIEIRDTLQISNTKEIEDRPNEKKGVISTMDLVAISPNDVE